MATTKFIGGPDRARLNQLRRRIERWRWGRTKRSPMPAELWEAATGLAREVGAYRVAREVGVNCGSLRDRLGTEAERRKRNEQGFVELAGASLFASAPIATCGEVELSDGKGSKVVIRLAADQRVDVVALVAAFRGERA